MANTLSVMTNVLRNVVSKQRIRYKENGFNLDLAYICDNIIAMGYPADNIEKLYRNPLEDVYKFLEENHPDHYKIYNLCLERSYNKNKFHGRVSVYAFEDHNPPTIELIQKFCLDVDTWLKADEHNVAAVHCKAGKGRTGTMICCYLLYSGQQGTAEDALSCYDEKRTKDRKGVTIPSQRRYVQYFSKLIRSGMPYERRSLQLRQIRFIEANLLHSKGTMKCSVSVLQDTSSTFKVQLLDRLVIDFRKTFVLDVENVLSVAGDIKIELTHKTSKIFHFWFNTFFVNDEAVVEGEGDDAKLVYTLSKWEIDDAHKDKEHSCFSKDFMVALVFSTESSTSVGNVSNGNSSIKNKTRSGNSNADATHCPLPENNSSGSDLNFISDQKSSSSSASVNSMGFANTENAGPSKCHNTTAMRRLIGGSAPDQGAPPFPLSSPPGHFDASSCFGHGCGESENQAYNMYALPSLAPTHHPQTILQQKQQQQQLQRPAGTPKQQQQNNFNNALASTPIGGPSYAINLRQPKMNYQPSANIKPNISRVGRETHSNSNSNNNNSRGSSSSTNNHNNNNNVQLSHATTAAAAATNSSNSSKNSSISSHSSASTNIGDNDEDDDAEEEEEEEDWESGESQAKPFVRNALVLSPMIMTMTSPSTIHTSIISASNLHTNDYLNLVSSTSSSSGFNDLNIGGDDINDDDDDDDENEDDCNDNEKHDDANDNGDGDKVLKSMLTAATATKDASKSPPHNDLVNSCSRPKNPTNCDKQNATTIPIPEQMNEQTEQQKQHHQQQQQHESFFVFQTPTNSLAACRRPSVKSKPKMLCSDLSAKSSKCAKSDSVAVACSESACGFSSGGLAAASKQKLKIKLKSNKLKQKFEWFHSYFRSDPIDFCENFVQQTTAMRRNSNCSASSHNKATATPNSTPSATPITVQSPPHAGHTLRPPTKSEPNCSSTAPKTTEQHAEDGSDDYYSAICDKQLSFNNSPCKSPRTMASNGETHRRGHRLTPATATPTFVSYRDGSHDSSADRTAQQNVVVAAAKPKQIGFNIGAELPTMLLDKCSIQEDAHETVDPEASPCDAQSSGSATETVTPTTDGCRNVSIAKQAKPTPLSVVKPCELLSYVLSCQNEASAPSPATALDVTSANSNNSSSSGILTSSDCCTHNSESSCDCANPFRFGVAEQKMTIATGSDLNRVVVVGGAGGGVGNEQRRAGPVSSSSSSSSVWAREAGPCEQVVAVTLIDSIVE